MRALGQEDLGRLIDVKRADNLAQAPEYQWVSEKVDAAEKLLDEMLRREPCLQLKDLAVNGNDLLALGYSGREIGLALQRLLQAVVAGEIENRREVLLAALKR